MLRLNTGLWETTADFDLKFIDDVSCAPKWRNAIHFCRLLLCPPSITDFRQQKSKIITFAGNWEVT